MRPIICSILLACGLALSAAQPSPPLLLDKEWVLVEADLRGATYVNVADVTYSDFYGGAAVWITTFDKQDKVAILRLLIYQGDKASKAIEQTFAFAEDGVGPLMESFIISDPEQLNWLPVKGYVKAILNTLQQFQ